MAYTYLHHGKQGLVLSVYLSRYLFPCSGGTSGVDEYHNFLLFYTPMGYLPDVIPCLPSHANGIGFEAVPGSIHRRQRGAYGSLLLHAQLFVFPFSMFVI